MEQGEAIRDPGRTGLLRLLVLLGGIAALWLIAPAAAKADVSLGGATEAVDDTTSSATEVVDNTTSTATDTVDDAASTATGAADDSSSTANRAATDATSTVTGAAGDAASTVTRSADVTSSKTMDGATRSIGSAADVADHAAEGVVRGVYGFGGAVGRVAGSTLGAAAQTLDRGVDLADGMTRTIGRVANVVGGPADHVGEALIGSLQRVTSDILHGVPSLVDAPSDPSLATWRPAPDLAHRPDVSSLASRDMLSTIAGVPVGTNGVVQKPTGDPTAPALPEQPVAASTGSGLLDGLRTGSSGQNVAAFLAAMVIALALVRWSRREHERFPTPVFLSLVERPG